MTINRRKLFKDARAYAKAFAAFDGRSPRSLIGNALRKVWAEAKALAICATRPAIAPTSDARRTNPNFTTAVAAYRARLGSFCSHHW